MTSVIDNPYSLIRPYLQDRPEDVGRTGPRGLSFKTRKAAGHYLGYGGEYGEGGHGRYLQSTPALDPYISQEWDPGRTWDNLSEVQHHALARMYGYQGEFGGGKHGEWTKQQPGGIPAFKQWKGEQAAIMGLGGRDTPRQMEYDKLLSQLAAQKARQGGTWTPAETRVPDITPDKPIIIDYDTTSSPQDNPYTPIEDYIRQDDWRNAQQFDYRGLPHTIRHAVARYLGYPGEFGGGAHGAWMDQVPGRREAYNEYLDRLAGYSGPGVPQFTPIQSARTIEVTPEMLMEITPDMVPTVTRDMTVAGQLDDLIAEGSSYIEQARGEAAQAAAGRGLLNTGLAGRQGVLAARQAAFPIAQADAETQARFAQENASRYYNAAQQNAQRHFDTALENIRASNQMREHFETIRLENEEAVRQREEQMLADFRRLQSQYSEQATAIIGAAAQEIGRVFATPGLNAGQQRQAVDLIETRRDADLEALAQLYTSLPLWSMAWDMVGADLEAPAPGRLPEGSAVSMIEEVVYEGTNLGGERHGQKERIVKTTDGRTVFQYQNNDGTWSPAL